jgi:hypothetical protein
MSTIHDLSIEISEIRVWDLLIITKIVMKNFTADLQITIIEVVTS